MKTISNIIASVLFLFLLVQCAEMPNWNDELKDSDPPGMVTNATVENIPGGAVISYSLPSGSDLLGVKAVYSYKEQGDTLEAYSSAFATSIKLMGFPDTRERKVKLLAIDKSKNESKPVEVTIQPLTPPVETIRQSLKVYETFSGVFVAWDNTTQADIGISLYVKDSLGFWNLDYTYFTKEKSGNFSFRGYEHKERNFRVQIRDRWNNSSSPLDTTLTPLFEENVVAKDGSQLLWQRYGYEDKTTLFRGDFPGQYSSSAFSRMFNNNAGNSYFHTGLDATHFIGVFINNSDKYEPIPLGLTIDMTRETKLSRFVQYFRTDLNELNQNELRVFELWATNQTPKGPSDFSNDRIASLAYWTPWPEVNGTDAWKNDWKKLGEYVVVPPSGATEAYQWTNEDIAWGKAGVEFEIDPQYTNTPFRYLRIICYENHKHTNVIHFTEWDFFGSVVNK